jgi:hypothetical protein
LVVRRFWIEFESPRLGEHGHPAIKMAGCGVTASDLEDALSLLKQHVFPTGLPSIGGLVEDVDVSTLDQGHVLPNMGNVLVRGIWFPVGFTPESRLSF